MASTALETVTSASSEVHSARRGIAERIRKLDGIRGVVILGVMLFHYASLTPGT